MELTEKQKKWLEARAEGNNPTASARIAGYAAPDVTGPALNKNKKLAEINRAIAAENGMTHERFLQKVIEGMSAKKKVVVRQKWGSDIIEDEDHLAQAKYTEIFRDLTALAPVPETRIKVDGKVKVQNTEPMLTDPSLLQLTGQALLDAVMLRIQQRRLGYITATNDPANGILPLSEEEDDSD